MKVVIVYETLTGTTQYVAEVMKDTLVEHGHTVDLHSVRYQGLEPKILDYDVILFGAPTYEDGKLEQGMRNFIARCKENLAAKKVAVFGLGNSTYPQFCVSAQILEDWVIKQSGTPLIPTLKVDGFPDDISPITTWIHQLDEALKK
jgi:flavodoxin I